MISLAQVAEWLARGDLPGVFDAIRIEPDLVRKHLPDRDTLLHVAGRHGQIGALVALFVAGADVNAAGASGHTPLHAVLLRGGPLAYPMVGLLVDHGADPTRTDDAAMTAIALGRQLSVRDEVQRLLEGRRSP